MRALSFIAVMGAVATLTACDGDTESADTPGTKEGQVPELAPGQLGAIQQALRAFEPTVVSRAHLPGVEPLLKQQVQRVGDRTAAGGLRVELAGRGVGYLYRYKTPRLAEIAAPGFLGGDDAWAGGVGACGSHVYFTDGLDQKQRDTWSGAAERAVRRNDPTCRQVSRLMI